jgi:predicted nucleotidyltransferase
MEQSLETLKSFNWKDFGVAFAVLFGSRVRGNVFKGDWDIAAWLEEPGGIDAQFSRVADLQYSLAKHLGVPEEAVDIVVLNRYEELPCTLLIEILGRGKPIYVKDFEAFLDVKLRILFPCFDFMIDAKKLRLSEVQREAVTRRWQS